MHRVLETAANFLLPNAARELNFVLANSGNWVWTWGNIKLSKFHTFERKWPVMGCQGGSRLFQKDAVRFSLNQGLKEAK